MNLNQVVTAIAPTLGGLLTGGASDIVQTAIASIFGADLTKPEEIAKKISDDPAAKEKLLQLNIQLKQLGSDIYKAEVDDRKNAREMQIQNKSIVPHLIAGAFVIIYAFIQYNVIHNPGAQDDIISARVQDILFMILGFYYGKNHN